MAYSSTVRWQGKSHRGIPGSVVLVSGTPSVVIDGRRSYKTKGTAKSGEINLVMLSLQPSVKHISQLSVLGYLATFLTEGRTVRKCFFPVSH